MCFNLELDLEINLVLANKISNLNLKTIKKDVLQHPFPFLIFSFFFVEIELFKKPTSCEYIFSTSTLEHNHTNHFINK